MMRWIVVAALATQVVTIQPGHTTVLTNCALGVVDAGGGYVSAARTGNMDGYQTMSETYTCDQGSVELKGRWDYVIQRGYIYHNEMGRISMEPPRYVGIPSPTNALIPSFQKWCESKPNGIQTFTLCGTNDGK